MKQPHRQGQQMVPGAVIPEWTSSTLPPPPPPPSGARPREERSPGRLQMDILSAVVRIEQAHAEPGMSDFLLHRLATCDAVRLRRHLTPETLAWEAEMRSQDPAGHTREERSPRFHYHGDAHYPCDLQPCPIIDPLSRSDVSVSEPQNDLDLSGPSEEAP